MITPTNLDELGTDELHASMTEAIRELPEEHAVRVLWGRLDEILTDGGPECLRPRGTNTANRNTGHAMTRSRA